MPGYKVLKVQDQSSSLQRQTDAEEVQASLI